MPGGPSEVGLGKEKRADGVQRKAKVFHRFKKACLVDSVVNFIGLNEVVKILVAVFDVFQTLLACSPDSGPMAILHSRTFFCELTRKRIARLYPSPVWEVTPVRII